MTDKHCDIGFKAQMKIQDAAWDNWRTSERTLNRIYVAFEKQKRALRVGYFILGACFGIVGTLVFIPL